MSEFKYAYEKLMSENNLKISDLPEDAKIGITAIKNIEKAMAMAEKSGKKISSDTLAKIKANDKWAVNEILDYIDETDENAEEMPYEAQEVVEEIKEGEVSEVGLSIEKELAELHKSGKAKFTADEIKASAKKTYNTIFDNYEDDGENGIETSNYKLIESEQEIFTLTKK